MTVRTAFVAAVVTGCMAAGMSSASADVNCNEFFGNPDGSWTPTHPIVIGGPASPTQIGPSDRLSQGMPGFSGRLAHYLDVHCRLGGAALRIPKMP